MNMIRKLVVTAAIAASTVGFGTAALAANCATISVSPASPAIPSWNPINPAAQEANFAVTMTRTKGSSKSARLIFLDSNSSATPTRIRTATGPRYQIINVENGAVISFPSGTRITGVTVPTTAFGNGAYNAVTVNMKVRILANSAPSEDFVGGASYIETLDYAVECFKNNGSGSGNSDGEDGASVSNLTLSLTIPKLVSIVTATPATINFGNFTTTFQQAQVTVKSTSTLNISATTSNGGKLVRSGAIAPYPTNSTILYGMKFNSVTLTPGTPLTNQTRAGVLGNSYPLQLTLTDGIPSGKLAGTYNDTITLTITPGI